MPTPPTRSLATNGKENKYTETPAPRARINPSKNRNGNLLPELDDGLSLMLSNLYQDSLPSYDLSHTPLPELLLISIWVISGLIPNLPGKPSHPIPLLT